MRWGFSRALSPFPSLNSQLPCLTSSTSPTPSASSAGASLESGFVTKAWIKPQNLRVGEVRSAGGAPRTQTVSILCREHPSFLYSLEHPDPREAVRTTGSALRWGSTAGHPEPGNVCRGSSSARPAWRG